MPTECSTVDVPLAPDVALAWLADPANMERWHPLYRDVRVEGADVSAILDFYGQAFAMELSVESGAAAVVVSGAGKRMGLVDRIAVEAVDVGSRLHYELELSTRGALRPLSRGLTPVAERAAARAAKRLVKNVGR